MVYDGVNHAHALSIIGGVFAAKEKDFSGKLLANLSRKICRTKAAIKACNIGIGLFKASVFFACQCEIGNYVQTVATTGGPTWHNADHNLGHESD